MLDVQPGHREVLHVGGREARADADRGGADEAVGLMQRRAAVGVLASPAPCEHAFADSERRDTQPVEESSYEPLLVGAHPAPDLLDGDGAHPRLGADAAKASNSSGRGPTSERVDEHRRVEQQARHSAGPTGVTASLRPHPLGRVVVPGVSGVSKRAERAFYLVPSPLVLESSPDQSRDERAALAVAHPGVELGDELVVQGNVQSHVLMLAHIGRSAGGARQRSLLQLDSDSLLGTMRGDSGKLHWTIPEPALHACELGAPWLELQCC